MARKAKSKTTSNPIAAKAARILRGGAFTHADVLAICASCVAQSERDKAKTKAAPRAAT